MPIVPTTSVKSGVQSAYNVRSTSSASSLQDVGNAISNSATNMGNTMNREAALAATKKDKLDEKEANLAEKEAKKKSKINVNDAIYRTSEAQSKATITFNEKTKRVDVPLQDFDRAKEELSKSFDDAATNGASNLSTEDEKLDFDDWYRNKKLSHDSEMSAFVSKKLDSINVENTSKGLNLAQAAFIAAPNMDHVGSVKLAIEASADAKNLSVEGRELYVKTEKQGTLNSVIDNYVNNDDLEKALSFAKSAQKEMDAKTYEGYVGRLTRDITEKSANTAGESIARAAKYIDQKTGTTEVDRDYIVNSVAKLPKEQQDIATAKATRDANYGVTVRAEQAQTVYFGRWNDVDSGADPETFPAAEKAILGVAYMGALNERYAKRVRGNQEAINTISTAKADANTATVSTILYKELGNLSPEDTRYATQILEAKFQKDDVKGNLIQSDMDNLRKYALARSQGKSTARNEDIMQAVAQVQSNEDLINPATQAAKDWIKSPKNSNLINFVQKNSIGIREEELPEKIKTLVNDYYLQSRAGENVGEVLNRGDKKEIANLQLDKFSDVESPVFKAQLTKYNYAAKDIGGLTKDGLRKLVTRSYLRDEGVISSYEYENGKIKRLDPQIILEGIRLEQMAEQAYDGTSYVPYDDVDTGVISSRKPYMPTPLPVRTAAEASREDEFKNLTLGK